MSKRCAWVNMKEPLLVDYHDNEWGRPVVDDTRLFEFLVLESAQAGLNWLTILKKRAAYREAYAYFDIDTVAAYDDKLIYQLMNNKGIVRNQKKIMASICNARVVQKLQTQYGSFSNYVWRFCNHQPVINRWPDAGAVPTTTASAQQFSHDFKQHGGQFFGPIIAYAFMQATGMVNDHTVDCNWSP